MQRLVVSLHISLTVVRNPLAVQIEDESYQLRPMNCPFHVLAYKNAKYSYRDLPLRWAELGTVYRYERSGTMHGLFRVRGFTQVCMNHILCIEASSLLSSAEERTSGTGHVQFLDCFLCCI